MYPSPEPKLQTSTAATQLPGMPAEPAGASGPVGSTDRGMPVLRCLKSCLHFLLQSAVKSYGSRLRPLIPDCRTGSWGPWSRSQMMSEAQPSSRTTWLVRAGPSKGGPFWNKEVRCTQHLSGWVEQEEGVAS